MALEQSRRRATIQPPSVRTVPVTVPDVASQSAVFGDDEATTEIGIILRRRSHFRNTTRDIARFFNRPAAEVSQPATVTAPPGAPIGDPAMDWLRRIEPACSWWDGGWDW